MKIPVNLPDISKIFMELVKTDPGKTVELIEHSLATDSKGRYLHWEKLRHLEPPGNFTPEQWWVAIKGARAKLHKAVNLFDKHGKPFKFAVPDSVFKELHWLDLNTAGTMSGGNAIANPQMRNTYLIRSLVDEAINSSQLEGASTTRLVAREMLRQGLAPRDRSERMIYNNWKAMRFIRDIKSETLTPSIILELHRILTEDTLDNPGFAGRYRVAKDNIYVVDEQTGETLHVPPDAGELSERAKKLCRFANGSDSRVFIHPVVRAIILHFMLAYDHPFVDGNGRTARALFYWSMANQGYWMMEFISISRVIKRAPSQYSKAFLHTETDDNDMTYFVIHQLEVIRKAIDQLKAYLNKQALEMESAEKLLEGTRQLGGQLNYRQLGTLRHALKNPGFVYTIRGHKNTHGITYETARKDLLRMAEDLKLLKKRKINKTFEFVSPDNLREKIEKAKR